LNFHINIVTSLSCKIIKNPSSSVHRLLLLVSIFLLSFFGTLHQKLCLIKNVQTHCKRIIHSNLQKTQKGKLSCVKTNCYCCLSNCSSI